MPLLFGETPSGLMVPLALNEDGSPIGSGQGYVGAAWQKNPLTLGYSGVVRRYWSNTDLDDGINNEDDSAVPAGEIWVITSFSFLYVGTVPDGCRWIISSGGTTYYLDEQIDPGTAQIYGIRGQWVLEEDDFLRIRIAGATATDDLHAYAYGTRIDIDQ